MVSMSDVARRAGVAKSTVSRILSGNGTFCPETCAKVVRACEELNYKLNPNIQDLVWKGRSGVTRNMAVIMVRSTFANQAYSGWVDAITEEICGRHYHLMLVKLTGDEGSVYELPSVLRDERVDGIFITGSLTRELMGILNQLETPIVVFGSYDKAILGDCGNVTVDLEYQLRGMLLEMKQRGVRRPAYVDEGQDTYSDQVLFASYRRLMAELKLEFDETCCFFGRGRETGMFEYMLPVFSAGELPFDGVFCPDLRIAREIYTLYCMRCGFDGMHRRLNLATILKPESPELPADTIFAKKNYDNLATKALDMMIALIAGYKAEKMQR